MAPILGTKSKNKVTAIISSTPKLFEKDAPSAFLSPLAANRHFPPRSHVKVCRKPSGVFYHSATPIESKRLGKNLQRRAADYLCIVGCVTKTGLVIDFLTSIVEMDILFTIFIFADW